MSVSEYYTIANGLIHLLDNDAYKAWTVLNKIKVPLDENTFEMQLFSLKYVPVPLKVFQRSKYATPKYYIKHRTNSTKGTRTTQSAMVIQSECHITNVKTNTVYYFLRLPQWDIHRVNYPRDVISRLHENAGITGAVASMLNLGQIVINTLTPVQLQMVALLDLALVYSGNNQNFVWRLCVRLSNSDPKPGNLAVTFGHQENTTNCNFAVCISPRACRSSFCFDTLSMFVKILRPVANWITLRHTGISLFSTLARFVPKSRVCLGPGLQELLIQCQGPSKYDVNLSQVFGFPWTTSLAIHFQIRAFLHTLEKLRSHGINVLWDIRQVKLSTRSKKQKQGQSSGQGHSKSAIEIPINDAHDLLSYFDSTHQIQSPTAPIQEKINAFEAWLTLPFEMVMSFSCGENISKDYIRARHLDDDERRILPMNPSVCRAVLWWFAFKSKLAHPVNVGHVRLWTPFGSNQYTELYQGDKKILPQRMCSGGLSRPCGLWGQMVTAAGILFGLTHRSCTQIVLSKLLLFDERMFAMDLYVALHHTGDHVLGYLIDNRTHDFLLIGGCHVDICTRIEPNLLRKLKEKYVIRCFWLQGAGDGGTCQSWPIFIAYVSLFWNECSLSVFEFFAYAMKKTSRDLKLYAFAQFLFSHKIQELVKKTLNGQLPCPGLDERDQLLARYAYNMHV